MNFQKGLSKMRHPDVIGIGFRRSASSWLHNCLNEHPSIGKNKRGIHYFSNHIDKGNEWYLQQFSEHVDKDILVDFSVSYTYPENVQQFVNYISDFIPQVKLFAIVRDPVERAYSDYRRSIFIEEYPINMTFQQAIEKYPILLERGHYGKILQKVLQIVPKKHLKIIFYDDINHPERLWSELCDYIGVSPLIIPSCLYMQVGHLATPKNTNVLNAFRLGNKIIGQIAKNVGLNKFWISIKTTKVWQRLVELNLQKVVNLNQTLRHDLLSLYYEDITFIEEFTDRDLSAWRQG